MDASVIEGVAALVGVTNSRASRLKKYPLD